MSASSSFQSVVYYGSQGISVLTPKNKGWQLVESFDFDTPISAKAKKALAGSVLVLVSDTYCGHLQVLFPNKKSELSEELVAEVLEKEYEIDTVAYEFASQKFTLSREQVQMSISGVERQTYEKIQALLSQVSPKKAWIMPFGWFVSALKSVEPVLLAIALSESEILVSHHYLGVDDAREIALKDLVSYIKSRKNERKETHLLYLQAEESLQKKMTEAVGDAVATHPLIDSVTNDSILGAIIEAVWTKGEDALSNLLHFEVDVSESSAESVSKKELLEEPKLDIESANEVETLAVSDLPKPQPPEVQDAPEEAQEEIPESEDSESESETEVTATETVVTPVVSETPSQEDSEVESVPEVIEEATKEVAEQATEEKTQETIESPAEEKSVFADLQSANMARSGEERYREVPKKSSWKTIVFVFLGVVLVTSLVGGAVFWSQQSTGVQQPLLPETSPTPTPIIEAEPEASESAEPVGVLSETEKEDISILVLNATGVAGLAGKTRTELENAGWSDISVGNATGSYNDGIFVQTKNDKVITTLEKDLKIKVSETNNITESKSDEYDVVFIIADEVPWQ